MGALTFFSDFEAGNLLQVQAAGRSAYELLVAPDAYGVGQRHCRVWFYFGIRGLARNESIQLCLANLSAPKTFGSPTYRLVYCCLPSSPDWKRLPTPMKFEQVSTSHCRLYWKFQATAANQDVYFAFAPPYTPERLRNLLATVSANKSVDTYYHEEVLTETPDKRPVHLLTLTDQANVETTREDTLPHLFPQFSRPCKAVKPTVFLTCRVHPGETPASYWLEAFLTFLISNDRRAVVLRKAFVFKVVPMLNPDGVVRGHFRSDQFGINLNRQYVSPSLEQEPAVFAVRAYADYLHQSLQSLCMFFDVHAQASKRSCWVFGNALDVSRQVENLLLPKLVALNTGYFDFNSCDFSLKSMQRKDPKDLHSKEGSARVAVHRRTGVVHCYTLECPYYSPLGALRKNRLTQGQLPVFNRSMYVELAEAVGAALLDYNLLNPLSKLGSAPAQVLRDLRGALRASSQKRYSASTTNLRVAWSSL